MNRDPAGACVIYADWGWGQSRVGGCGWKCEQVGKAEEVQVCVRVFVQLNHRCSGLIESGVLSGRTMVDLTGKESNLITTDTWVYTRAAQHFRGEGAREGGKHASIFRSIE